MKTFLKYLTVLSGVIIVCYVGYRLFTEMVFSGGLEKKYTMTNAIDNYNKNEKNITELINYFQSVVPHNRDITFGRGEKTTQLSIGIALPNGAVDSKYPGLGGSNLELDDPQTDSLLSLINWNRQTVDTLKKMLNASDCINLMSGDPLRIEYRYSGFGLFSYLIFSKSLPDSTIRKYVYNLGDIVVRNNVVIIYTSSL